jgi:fluoride exporter
MKQMVIQCLAIGVAGSVGAVARFVIVWLYNLLNIRFPLGTMFINISGSLFLGWFMAHIATRSVTDTTRLAIAVGFVGAYTTFSTYMYESNQMLEDGRELAALANIFGSLILGLIAVRLGIWLARPA